MVSESFSGCLLRFNVLKIVSLHAGAPPELCLPSMAKAVHLSGLHSGGMVEPFYQLHSQRLKLLLKQWPTTALLKTTARWVQSN